MREFILRESDHNLRHYSEHRPDSNLIYETPENDRLTEKLKGHEYSRSYLLFEKSKKKIDITALS